jgi:hypothetical protein
MRWIQILWCVIVTSNTMNWFTGVQLRIQIHYWWHGTRRLVGCGGAGVGRPRHEWRGRVSVAPWWDSGGREFGRGGGMSLRWHHSKITLCEGMRGLLEGHAHTVKWGRAPLGRGRGGHLTRMTAILIEAVISVHHWVWILHHVEHIPWARQLEGLRFPKNRQFKLAIQTTIFHY